MVNVRALAGAFVVGCILLPSCGVRGAGHTPPPGIGPAEVQLLHPTGRLVYRHVVLSAKQVEWIRTRLGEDDVPPRSVEYVEVQPFRNRGPHAQAQVFKAQGDSTEGGFSVLVCLSGGRVNEVHLLEGPSSNGVSLLRGPFLDQFAGMRDLDSPGQPRPLAGHDDLSRQVTRAIRRVAVLAAALQL